METNKNEVTLNEDEMTLSLIATGLMQLHEQVVDGKNLRYPYPISLERGLNKLTVIKLMRVQNAPQGIPDLLHWCHQDLSTWQLKLPEDAISGNDRLMEDQMPTNLCESWAYANPDVEAELSEQKLMKALFDVCQSNDAKWLYTNVRKLFITNPVLTALDYQQAQIEPDLEIASEIIRMAYVPAPSNTLIDGEYLCCAKCGNLLIRTPSNQPMCENERCELSGLKIGRKISQRDQAYWLRRGLRRFVNAPGIAEVELATHLESLDLQIELWPNYDSYDLRVHMPDGKVWAVDVKDWANPFILAKRVKPIPTDPDWDKAFFIFPNERHQQRSDYMRAFRNNTQVLRGRTTAMFSSTFIKEVQKYIEGLS